MWDPGRVLGWGEAVLYLHSTTVQKAAKNRRLLDSEGWEQAGASCGVSGCVPRLAATLENRGCGGSGSSASTQGRMRGTSCRGDSEGNCKEQPERHLSSSWREEAGWKKTREMGWKPTRRERSMGQICRSCQCHQRQAWRWGGSHPFQTRQRTLDALPEAVLQTHPELSRHRQREILFSCFKNKKSDKISREWCRLSPTPAPRASRVSPCFGDRDTDVALGTAVQVPREWRDALVCPRSYQESEGRAGCPEPLGSSICRNRAAAWPRRSNHQLQAAWLTALA